MYHGDKLHQTLLAGKGLLLSLLSRNSHLANPLRANGWEKGLPSSQLSPNLLPSRWEPKPKHQLVGSKADRVTAQKPSPD